MRFTRRCFFLSLLIFAPAYGASQGAVPSAKAAQAKAMAIIRKQAEEGNAQSMVAYGAMFERGEGVPQSDGEALKWFEKAAALGNSRAQFDAGAMYFYGRGVPMDRTRAADYFRKSAESGYPGAQEIMGALYENGLGVSHSYLQARRWYALAAVNGNLHAAKQSEGLFLRYWRKRLYGLFHQRAFYSTLMISGLCGIVVLLIDVLRRR